MWRHTVHEKELGGSEPKRGENRRIERLRRLAEVSRQNVVEAQGAPERLLDEGAQEVAVPRRQLAPARVHERSRMGTVPGHAHEDAQRQLAHGPRRHQPQRSPGETRSPRTNSAAGSALRPSA
jgi:hypothetical protein